MRHPPSAALTTPEGSQIGWSVIKLIYYILFIYNLLMNIE
jgi:hypothetical protein